MKTSLQDLSTEILIKVFEYCDIRDLFNLQKTCRRFSKIIKTAPGLGNTNPLLVTNQLRQEIRYRCLGFLTIKEKCRISNNWKNGIYEETFMLKEKRKCIPNLTLTKEHVWLSKSNKIFAYKRNGYRLQIQHPHYTIHLPVSADVCKFVFKQNHIISGQQDGSIFLWKSPNENVYLKNCHECDVNSVDFEANLFVSGSKDGFVKIWLFNEELQQNYEPMCYHNMNDRVWSTALVKSGHYLAIGTAGHNSVSPLHLYDLNRYKISQELGQRFNKGSGILQIKWENQFTLLTCGYDKNIRKWDIRTGTCEQSWEDPFYSTVYCFDTDNYCTILSGTQSHGRVVLWDMRFKHYIQMYFMETCKKSFYSSPIYSLSFDTSQLFTATDRYLNVLDFSTKTSVARNYNFLAK